VYRDLRVGEVEVVGVDDGDAGGGEDVAEGGCQGCFAGGLGGGGLAGGVWYGRGGRTVGPERARRIGGRGGGCGGSVGEWEGGASGGLEVAILGVDEMLIRKIKGEY